MDAGWQTVRQTALGFAIDLPPTWRIKTARVRRLHLLWLIPFEPEPRWSESDAGDWNRLVVDTGSTSVALQVSLNPAVVPAGLDEVVNDRWARLLNLRTVERRADTRLGPFLGFSVLQDLQGVGPSVRVGPVTVSAGSIKEPLMQMQAWVRAGELAVHVQHVAPTSDTALRATLDRAVATMRLAR